jgi:hypothetical protein
MLQGYILREKGTRSNLENIQQREEKKEANYIWLYGSIGMQNLRN